MAINTWLDAEFQHVDLRALEREGESAGAGVCSMRDRRHSRNPHDQEEELLGLAVALAVLLVIFTTLVITEIYPW